MIPCSQFWTQRSQEPEEFSTWSNKSFSPKEKIGTRAALEGSRAQGAGGGPRGCTS